MSYFERTGPNRFRPTQLVAGAWNTAEQHIAPALGVMAHVVERDRDARRTDGLVLTRVSYDILGVLPLEEVEVTTRLVRPGRTIELVEAVLSHAGRPAVQLRAWLQAERDTAAVAGTALPRIPGPDATPAWDPSTVWRGDFIPSLQIHREQEEPGRARFWARTDVPLLDEPTSAVVDVLGLCDIANGMTVREDPDEVTFPNLDLTAHLFRPPAPGWLGFDTTVSFGANGHGLTSTVLHDDLGPFGTLAQTLTVRPVATA